MTDKYQEVREIMAQAEDVEMGDVPVAATPDPGSGSGGDGPSAPGEATPPPEEIAAGFPLNDIGNGQRFRVYFGPSVMHVPRVAWFTWTGRHWQRDDDQLAVRALAQLVSGKVEQEMARLKLRPREVEKLMEEPELLARREVLGAIKVQERSEEQKAEVVAISGKLDEISAIKDGLKKRKDRHFTHARNTGNTGKIEAMLKESTVHLSRALEEIDADPLVVNTQSHTLRFSVVRDAESGASGVADLKVCAHDPGDLLTKCMSVAYDPEARAPKFAAFLERIQPSLEMRQFLCRWFGLSMTGRIEQKLAFFYGQGANGKSVLVDVMARVLDTYAASAKIESLTGQSKRGGADATPDLIPLMGARMVRASEPEEGERFKEGMIKELTGGEPILVRALHSDFVEVHPVFKLTISGNHKPEIRGTDDGIWRRVMLVPFDVQIPVAERRDFNDFVAELAAEGPGILNWMIEGLMDYLEGGLQVPLSVAAATEGYRKDSDPIGAFLTEHTVVDGGDDFITAADLIEAFRFWQTEEGDGAWGNRTVSLKMKERSDRWRHPSSGMKFTRGKQRVTGYRGIRLAEMFADRFNARPIQHGKRGERDQGDAF